MPTHRTPPRIKTVAFGFHASRGLPSPMNAADQHNEIEINLVEKGGLLFRRGTETINIAAGQATLYWAAVPHQILSVRPGTEISWIVLPLAWVLGWKLPSHFLRRLLNGEMIALPDALCYSIRTWATDFSHSELRLPIRLEIEAFFHRLALQKLARTKPKGGPDHQHRHVETMVRTMTEQFREPLTIIDIARSAGLTPEYAMRLFRQQWGVTLWTFLLQQRIAEARRLLLLGDDKLIEIAFACGFQSLSRFYHVFKKHCGCSPGAYRKSYPHTPKD